MMRKKHVLQFSLWAMILAQCVVNRVSDKKTVIHLNLSTGGKPVRISVIRGPRFIQKFKPGPFVINILPQMVFWTENGQGQWLETLYITGADGRYSRNATKNKLDSIYFEKCFPVWASRLKAAGGKLPSAEAPYSDAMTSATPQSSFDLNTVIGPFPEHCILFAEINSAMDTNAVYTQEKTDWIGQPSLIFAKEIGQSVRGDTLHLQAAGHGGWHPGDTGLYEEFDGMDSALDIVEDIYIMFK